MRKNGKNSFKTWPEHCIWPKPLKAGEGNFWNAEDAELITGDEELEELLEIKEYMDSLVEEGRLDSDYHLNEDFDDWDEEDRDVDESGDDEFNDGDDPWEPEIGIDYWDDGFDIDSWEEDVTSHINLIKMPLPSPVAEIEQIIGYDIINENIFRQAFTRRSFAIEYGTGSCEELEFLGDSILNILVTREVFRQVTDVDVVSPEAPFKSAYHEGEMTKLRTHFICRDYLCERAKELGLDQYILYGTGEEPGPAACEDMMEAIIGAVAVDSNWDWHQLETAADCLLCIQLSNPDRYLKNTYYDLFNSWHQRNFGQMPSYEVYRGRLISKASGEYLYDCTLRYFVPENDKGIRDAQRVDVQEMTRSAAREEAAKQAYRFLVNHGLWMRLEKAGLEPRLEDAINQLQELYQKKYVEEKPEYTFEELPDDRWRCECICGGIDGFGSDSGKTKAKKKAAYMVLVRLMKSAGICKKEWEQEMWEL